MRQKGVLCHAAPASEVIPDPVNLFEPGCHFSIRINIIRILVILKKTIPVHRALIIKIIIHIIDQFPAGRHFSVRIRIIRYIFHGVKGIPVNTAPALEIIPGSIKFFPADRHFSVIIQVVTVLVVLSPGSFDNGTIRILKIPDPVLIHPWVIASSLHGYRRLFGLSALYFCRRKFRMNCRQITNQSKRVMPDSIQIVAVFVIIRMGGFHLVDLCVQCFFQSPVRIFSSINILIRTGITGRDDSRGRSLQ